MRYALITLAMLMHMSTCAAEENEWPSDSAMGVAARIGESRDYFARLVETKQSDLIKLVSNSRSANSPIVHALQELHAEWLLYYPRECELFGALSGAGGSWQSTYMMKCEANLVYRRFHRLKYAISCISRIPQDRRLEYSLNLCLYQLSPLTYGKES